MRTLIYSLTAAALLTGTTAPAFAQDNMTPEQRRERYEQMSQQERAKFHSERREEWQKMSQAEKLKIIEKKRAERIQHMNEKWNKMSDEEKIKHVESMFNREHFKKHGGKFADDDERKRR